MVAKISSGKFSGIFTNENNRLFLIISKFSSKSFPLKGQCHKKTKLHKGKVGKTRSQLLDTFEYFYTWNLLKFIT